MNKNLNVMRNAIINLMSLPMVWHSDTLVFAFVLTITCSVNKGAWGTVNIILLTVSYFEFAILISLFKAKNYL